MVFVGLGVSLASTALKVVGLLLVAAVLAVSTGLVELPWYVPLALTIG